MPVTGVVTEQISFNRISTVLKIYNAVGYYSGQYYCIATNRAGSVVSQIANLHVQGNSYIQYNYNYTMHYNVVYYVHGYITVIFSKSDN